MSSVVLAVALALASPPPVPPAPASCMAIVDRTAALVGQAVDVLAAEKQKRGQGSAEAGVAALGAWVTANREAVAKERRAAADLHVTLATPDRDRCALYAQSTFHRVLTRVTDLAAFYADRAEVWRLLGDLFR